MNAKDKAEALVEKFSVHADGHDPVDGDANWSKEIWEENAKKLALLHVDCIIEDYQKENEHIHFTWVEEFIKVKITEWQSVRTEIELLK